MAKTSKSIGLQGVVTTFFEQFDQLVAYASGGVLRPDDIMALLWLEEHYQSTAGDIASSLFLPAPRISRSLRRLSSAELLDETVNRDDFRRLRYRLSNRGENIVFEVRKKYGAQATGKILTHFCSLQQATRQVEEQLQLAKLSDSLQRVLPILYLARKPLSVKEVAQHSHLAQHRTSMALTSCEERGWLEKQDSEKDARVCLVQLSAKGRDVAKGLIAAFTV